MIAILGKMRLIILAVLLVVNAILAVQIYASIKPQQEKIERDTRMTRGRINTLRNDLEQMRVGFDILINQQEQFKNLENRGFFSNQSRYEAGRIFEKAQADSHVISAKARIKAGKILENEASLRAGQRILQSHISIRVEALEDTDILYYLSLLKDRMSGHVAVEKIEIKKVRVLDEDVLKKIASGESPVLLEADILLRWTTMISEALVINKQEDGG